MKEVIDVTKIDYLVVSHTEPDHAGSVERLLDYSPQMKDSCYRMCDRIFKGNREP